MEELLKLRKYIKIAHHIPGRIRLKIAISAIKELKTMDTQKLKSSFINTKGVKDFDFSKLSLSCTINYDSSIIEFKDWDNLLLKDENTASKILEKYKT